METACHWKPLSYLSTSSEQQIALLVLNTPLENLPRFKVLWQQAVLRVCADGAANELYKYNAEEKEQFMPDMITGDFDSATPQVLQHFQDKTDAIAQGLLGLEPTQQPRPTRGSDIINTPDQNETDFTKCLSIVLTKIKEENIKVDHVVVYVGFTGRFDHIIGNLNTLYLAQTMTKLPVYLMSGDTIAFLLEEGKHSIATSTGWEGSWCGLLPIGCPCESVTTTGLKWNLDKDRMGFGTLVSTSNKLDLASSQVTVETDKPLIWTMGVRADIDTKQNSCGL